MMLDNLTLEFNFSLNDLDVKSQEGYSVCSHSVVKLHEATQIFMMADYAREMTEEVL